MFEGDYTTIRPSFTGAREHDDQVATIILFKESQDEEDPNNKNPNKDYLNVLSGYVSTLITDSVISDVQGFPEIPNGKIARFKLDKKNDYYGIFNNFSVLSMAEMHDQISKVHMNFGAKWNVFLFGNTPNMYRVSGVFLDTKEYPYYQEFMTAYEDYLSGRKCVENGMQLKFIIAGQIIDGFLLNVSVNHNASTAMLKEFQFTILVKGSSWIRTNYIQILSEGGGNPMFSEQFNGMSNVYRLNLHKITGLIEEKNSTDSSGKVVDQNSTNVA